MNIKNVWQQHNSDDAEKRKKLLDVPHFSDSDLAITV